VIDKVLLPESLPNLAGNETFPTDDVQSSGNAAHMLRAPGTLLWQAAAALMCLMGAVFASRV
jgi:hypothetical protein